jgi:hypothetical protein
VRFLIFAECQKPRGGGVIVGSILLKLILQIRV